MVPFKKTPWCIGVCFISTALAVLFTLVDSGIYILLLVYSTIDSFNCYKLLNRVDPITQTRPEEKTKTKRDKKEKMEKMRKREKKGGKGGKGGKGEKGEKGEK